MSHESKISRPYARTLNRNDVCGRITAAEFEAVGMSETERFMANNRRKAKRKRAPCACYSTDGQRRTERNSTRQELHRITANADHRHDQLRKSSTISLHPHQSKSPAGLGGTSTI